MCSLVFEPTRHDAAIRKFTPPFQHFCSAAPTGAKLHITDAFQAGRDTWAKAASEARAAILALILEFNPMVVYSARRLRLARLAHERSVSLKANAQNAKRSTVKVVGTNRPSDDRVEDDLMICLALKLDAFAEEMGNQVHDVKQVDLLFDEADIAERYESMIERTRTISQNTHRVAGWDPTVSKPVEGTISFGAHAPFCINTKYLGGLHIVGKAHPLVFAADVVANHLAHHLGNLPPDHPLNAQSSISGWALESRVWGVMDGATDDIM